MSQPSSTSPAGPTAGPKLLTGKAKLDDVTRLLANLMEDLISSNLTPEQRKENLEQLKVHGRDRKDAEPIFTKDGIKVLTWHGLHGNSDASSLEALRCLANAMLLEPKTRQDFVDLRGAPQAAERLKEPESDSEFLISRIFFLLTYNTNLDFNSLFDKHSLGESINSHIARHSTQFAEKGNKDAPNSIDLAALSESLKLLFNLSNYYPNRTITFTPSIEHIFTIVNNIPLPTPPLQPPINHLINALVNLDLPNAQSLISPPSSSFNPVHPLLTILIDSLTTYPPSTLESTLPPLLTLLHHLHPLAPQSLKQHLQSTLLPSPSDRDLPLGQSATLPSSLLKLTTNPTTPHLRETIFALLFELSDRNPKVFIRNLGYGYAAGYLMDHNIAIPPESVGQEEAVEEELVNPITGQKISKEDRADDRPPMSEEEKEREAERLFVLFQRLRETGVVRVGDPLREAVEGGDV